MLDRGHLHAHGCHVTPFLCATAYDNNEEVLTMSKRPVFLPIVLFYCLYSENSCWVLRMRYKTLALCNSGCDPLGKFEEQILLPRFC